MWHNLTVLTFAYLGGLEVDVEAWVAVDVVSAYTSLKQHFDVLRSMFYTRPGLSL